MNCEHIKQLISPYLDQELSFEENEKFERHIHRCPECRELLEHMRSAQAALSEWPQLEVSPELHVRLAEIGATRKKTWFQLNFDVLFRPALQPVMAAFTVMLTLLSLFLMHPDREKIEQSLDRQLHIGYSKIQRLYVRAESFTDFLAVYKDNVVHSIKNITPKGDTEKNGG
jgi:hypothetical protein